MLPPPGSVIGQGVQGTVYGTTGAPAITFLKDLKLDMSLALPRPGAAVAIKKYVNAAEGRAEAATLYRLMGTEARKVVPRFYASGLKGSLYYVVMEHVTCGKPANYTNAAERARVEYSAFVLRKYGQVAHGDLHFENVIVCPRRVVLIDLVRTYAPSHPTPTLPNFWREVNKNKVANLNVDRLRGYAKNNDGNIRTERQKMTKKWPGARTEDRPPPARWRDKPGRTVVVWFRAVLTAWPSTELSTGLPAGLPAGPILFPAFFSRSL